MNLKHISFDLFLARFKTHNYQRCILHFGGRSFCLRTLISLNDRHLCLHICKRHVNPSKKNCYCLSRHGEFSMYLICFQCRAVQLFPSGLGTFTSKMITSLSKTEVKDVSRGFTPYMQWASAKVADRVYDRSCFILFYKRLCTVQFLSIFSSSVKECGTMCCLVISCGIYNLLAFKCNETSGCVYLDVLVALLVGDRDLAPAHRQTISTIALT